LTELPEKFIELVKLLNKTTAEEIDCDAFWDKAAYLAEQDLSLNLDELKIYLQHLDLCPGCAEQFELLKDVVKDVARTDG
jgi:hypothetical protein